VLSCVRFFSLFLFILCVVEKGLFSVDSNTFSNKESALVDNGDFLKEEQPLELLEGEDLESALKRLPAPKHLEKYGGFNRGGHNDYNSDLYAYHFKERLTYAEWQQLPRGVKEIPASGAKAYVISLTSWPARMKASGPGIWLIIESLMRQKTKPDRIILWLSLEEYPYGRHHLPKTLLDLEKRGLEIKFVKNNARAANKLLPALANKIKANIITVDDDILYPENTVCALKKVHVKNPRAIINNAPIVLSKKKGIIRPYNSLVLPPCIIYYDGFREKKYYYMFSAKQSPLAVLNGFSGVLYPFDETGRTFNGLHKRVLTPALIEKYAWTTDDLWFHVCRLWAKTDLWTSCFDTGSLEDQPYKILGIEYCQGALRDENHILNSRNDKKLRALIKEFPDLCLIMNVDPLKEHFRYPWYKRLFYGAKQLLGLKIG